MSRLVTTKVLFAHTRSLLKVNANLTVATLLFDFTINSLAPNYLSFLSENMLHCTFPMKVFQILLGRE